MGKPCPHGLISNDIIFQANAVIDLIGFPSYISNHTLLNEEYKDVRYSWKLE